MPELPEVEVTRLGIEPVLKNQKINHAVVHESRFRWPIPANFADCITGQAVHQVMRRGKYLIWDCDEGYVIIHLGMSGSLRVELPGAPLKKHDHVEWFVRDKVLRLHDPRRFGAVLWVPKNTEFALDDFHLFKSLGIEPFDERFDGQWMYQASRGKQISIKQFLLSGHVVVGAGNIYASESLFKAAINPKTQAGRIGLERYERLAQAVRETLLLSIKSGGSTLRDYVGAQGETGYFQVNTYVYGRAGEPCRVCGTTIKKIVQQQRATFFCTHCQH